MFIGCVGRCLLSACGWWTDVRVVVLLYIVRTQNGKVCFNVRDEDWRNVAKVRANDAV